MSNEALQRAEALLGNPLPTSIKENQIINIVSPVKKIDGRRNNRGIPGKAGKKPNQTKLIEKGIKQWIDDHAKEKVNVTYVDKTGKVRTIPKQRIMYAMEALFAIGVGMSTKGSPDAIAKWLDRIMGKPAQPIRGDGDEDAPIKVAFDIKHILQKAYDDDDSADEVHRDSEESRLPA